MIRRRAIGRASLAALLALGASAAAAQPAANALIGDWSNVRLREPPDSAHLCRYVAVETRQYHLAAGWNGEVHGSYLRGVWYLWLEQPAPGPGQCPARNGVAELPRPRTDSWFVQGLRQPDGSLGLSATHTLCDGPCEDGTQLYDQFQTVLTLRDGGMLDRADGTPEGPLRFVASEQALADQQAASVAVPELLRPWREGDCSRFYAQSLDPAIQSTVAAADFCRIFGRLGLLLGQARYEQPNPLAIRVSLGLLIVDGLVTAADGDVLVARNFVLDAQGNEAQIMAWLRRQADGSWKIARVGP